MKSVRLCEKVRFGPKFCKLQEATWLPVINEIFKFPRDSDPFCQLNYLLELSSGYMDYSFKNIRLG